MSGGAIILAYYKEGSTFSIVSGFESSYRTRISIPVGTANDDEFAKLNPEWIADKRTQYVIDHHTTADHEGRYSIRRRNDIFGFPKGGIKPGETPLNTAIREFGEEVGYGLDQSRLNELGVAGEYTVYTYNVSAAEKTAIDASIAAMKAERKGELFETRFRGLGDIRGRNLNQKSSTALALFQANTAKMGGKRNTRKKTMKRKRAKRQTSK
jgi:predicted NUDIX family NTP pyrophosphohydrolase